MTSFITNRRGNQTLPESNWFEVGPRVSKLGTGQDFIEMFYFELVLGPHRNSSPLNSLLVRIPPEGHHRWDTTAWFTIVCLDWMHRQIHIVFSLYDPRSLCAMMCNMYNLAISWVGRKLFSLLHFHQCAWEHTCICHLDIDCATLFKSNSFVATF